MVRRRDTNERHHLHLLDGGGSTGDVFYGRHLRKILDQPADYFAMQVDRYERRAAFWGRWQARAAVVFWFLLMATSIGALGFMLGAEWSRWGW